MYFYYRSLFLCVCCISYNATRQSGQMKQQHGRTMNRGTNCPFSISNVHCECMCVLRTHKIRKVEIESNSTGNESERLPKKRNKCVCTFRFQVFEISLKATSYLKRKKEFYIFRLALMTQHTMFPCDNTN